MKAKFKKNKGKHFKPITLKIKIESYDELLDLWHRSNLSTSVIENNVSTSYKYPKLDNTLMWLVIDTKVKELNK